MKTALILLDFINDIVHPDGKIAASAKYIEEHQVINRANELINWARNNDVLIIFVKVGFNMDYIDCPENSPVFGRIKQLQALQLNSWGTEIHEKINIQSSDIIIIKHRVSAFFKTSLEEILKTNQIQNLLIAGVSTDMAVQATARDAHDRDYNVTIISDACAASSQEIHENTLTLLKKVATVRSLD